MSLLVVLVIVGIGMALVLNGDVLGIGKAPPARPDNVGKTNIGRSAAMAKDVVCRSNIGQLRMAIGMARDTDSFFRSLDDVPGFGPDFKKCIIPPNEAYVYDPSTGQVFCPHPGHEKY